MIKQSAMTIYFPGDDALSKRLQQNHPTVVLCFCAAWCDSCTQYQEKFEVLSAQYPEASFVWIDIEEYPELLGEEDVENFPTVAIMHGQEIRFMGTLLPHIGHLDRLIQAMEGPGKNQQTTLPENLITLLGATGTSGMSS